MHACAALLEEMLSLARLEEAALNEEDLDKVAELTEKRAALLQEVWRQREGYDETSLLQSLLLLDEEQKKLQKQAELLHETYREQQNNGRKQAKYFAADRHVYTQSNKSLYFNKIS